MKKLNQPLTLALFLCTLFPYLATAQQFERVVQSPITSDITGSRSAAWVDVNGDGFLDAFIF